MTSPSESAAALSSATSAEGNGLNALSLSALASLPYSMNEAAVSDAAISSPSSCWKSASPEAVSNSTKVAIHKMPRSACGLRGGAFITAEEISADCRRPATRTGQGDWDYETILPHRNA